mmetsp:Transcript_74103/g.136741  ORF Transcript_74103/g.136741 Transcript_74103/m.136741 type:complete len:93 (-) Transcript_74103:397-675(-)
MLQRGCRGSPAQHALSKSPQGVHTCEQVHEAGEAAPKQSPTLQEHTTPLCAFLQGGLPPAPPALPEQGQRGLPPGCRGQGAKPLFTCPPLQR